MMISSRKSLFLRLFLSYLLLAYCAINLASDNSLQEIAAASSIIKAIENNTRRPVPSVTWTNFDERQAYSVQKRVVANLSKQGQSIVAYKAGLTAHSAAEKFALSGPITGVLFHTQQLKKLTTVSLTGSHRLLLEQELAFLISADINNKIADVASLKGHFSHVAMAIEFPDLGFTSQPQGLDIIANNVINRYFYHGQWQVIPESVNQLAFKMTCGEEIISQGRADSVMGDQWQALLWMVNHLHDLGYPLRKGHSLLTGNIGLLMPAKLCDYRADFASLGHLSFTVVP